MIEQANELGFELAGVAEAQPPLTIGFYERWLEQGYGSGMGYLATSVELRRTLDSLLPGARSVLAVGINYNQDPGHEPGHPKIARYALGRDYHKVLRGKLGRLSKEIALAFPDSSTRVAVDSAPLLEREWAQRAGLGWFGKNTCLLNSHRGSWFLLGFLLTDLEAVPTGQSEGGCGSCRMCIDQCPTGAIVPMEDRWVVDSRLCISYWTIEHKGDIPNEIANQMGELTFGCDICQEVCPFNTPRDSQPLRAQTTNEPDFLSTKRWPNLQQLAQISYEDWDVLTQGSPVRRAGWEGIRRNASINLRNLSPDQGV